MRHDKEMIQLLKNVQSNIREKATEANKWYGTDTLPAVAFRKGIRIAIQAIEDEVTRMETSFPTGEDK